MRSIRAVTILYWLPARIGPGTMVKYLTVMIGLGLGKEVMSIAMNKVQSNEIYLRDKRILRSSRS